MNKLINSALLLTFLVAKVQGVEAQSTIFDETKLSKKEIVKVSPQALGDALMVDPYEYSTEKKANKIMAEYLKVVEAEKKQKEDKRKLEQAKEAKVLGQSFKKYVDTRTDFISLYEKAGKMFGINPKLLQAVHIVETGASGSTARSSYAGAQGPMQFMPATFRAYGVDGNGDGTADINNVDDAIFSAAKYLAANGGTTDKRQALWHYNHSSAYVEKVLGIAVGLGM